MTKKPYKPLNPETIGTTVSCYTLARMLDEIANPSLNKKIIAHINRFFREVKCVSLGIHCAETRIYVGNMLLKHVKNFPADVVCPDHVSNVIRNIKYAYIKDMFIAETPINYTRSLEDDSTVPLECREFTLLTE